MRKRRKDALKLLAIATPMLAYGAYTFELGGIASSLVSAAVAVAITFGSIGTIGGLIMFFTKNSLGLINPKEPKVEIVEEEEPNDSWREDTVWEKEEPVQEEEPKLKMPS